jgi:hypothetical protein
VFFPGERRAAGLFGRDSSKFWQLLMAFLVAATLRVSVARLSARAYWCGIESPLDPIAAAPVSTAFMLAETEAFTRRPIIFMDDHACTRRIFVSDTTMPALAILIADYSGGGGHGGQP